MRKPTEHPFWERVKRLLRINKISQEKLASYVSVNCSTMKHWICYGILPDVMTASNIADALGVTLEFLIKGSDGQTTEGHEQELMARKIIAAEIRKMALQIEKSVGII